MIHYVTPYRIDRALGRAYNDSCSLIGENDWICLRDIDTLFLTPEDPAIIEGYVSKYPDTGIFTCYTNRLHTGAYNQLLSGVSEDTDILNHIRIAQNMMWPNMMNESYPVSEITKHISGMLMVISKKTWNEIKFNEDGKCLGVDNDFSDRVLASGRKILRMNRLYIWHSYRLIGGVKDKSHLL